MLLVLLLPLVLGEISEITICPTAGLTGYPCPGCGLTRAALAVVRGDFATALAFHPLVFVVGPAAVGYLCLAAVDVLWPLRWFRSASAARWGSRLALALALLLFVVWVARFVGAWGGPVPTRPWFW